MSGAPAIQSWECSFYKNDTKKWQYGKLGLHSNYVEFLAEVKGKNTLKKVIVSFSNVVEIKKAKSTLIYACIVLGLNGQQVWFSSFVNRDEVFNKLELFWREFLLESRTVSKRVNPNQELLEIAYESQDVLVDAATTLHNQGKQLTHAAVMMDNLHNDITVAERITGDIESWVGAWRVKGVFQNPHILTKRDKSPLSYESIEYPVLYAKLAQESHASGQLVFRNDNLEILNEKSEIVYSFAVKQISDVNVHSPWDVTMKKRNLGKPDVKVHVTSPRMSVLLKTLERTSQCQFDFDDPPNAQEEEVKEVEEIGGSGGNKRELLKASGTGTSLEVNTGNNVQIYKQKQISKEDENELSKVLNNMKSLALNISVEQDAQLKQIDSLSQSVDRANSRIKSTDWRVKNAT